MSALIIDTSVWIEYLEGKPLQEVDLALKEGRVILPPVVFAELLSGRTAGSDDRRLLDFLLELDLHLTPRAHWMAVGRLRRHCGLKGFRVSIPDAHVAQCALDLGGTVYSFDKIFLQIAKHAPLKLLRSRE